jgi:ParB-like nuclease domain
MPTPTDFQPLEYHPLANLFPMMDDAALRELADDIRAHGVHDPIVLHEEKILEGRSRHAACMIAGVEPSEFCKPFDSESMGEPLAYVISKNLIRRHLTESQRAMIAAKLATFTHGGDRRTDQPATRQLARRTAAAALNVSERSVARAAVVRNQGAPELIAAVEAGDIPVSVAANLARQPQQRGSPRRAAAGTPVDVQPDEDAQEWIADTHLREIGRWRKQLEGVIDRGEVALPAPLTAADIRREAEALLALANRVAGRTVPDERIH